MSVVNVKVKYIRPKYNNLEEWMSDRNNVYIGRSGVVFINSIRFPKANSVWSNPFKIGRDGNRDDVILKYETYIKQKIENKEVDLGEIRGKILGCWCKEPNNDIACHGDVLLKLLKDD